MLRVNPGITILADAEDSNNGLPARLVGRRSEGWALLHMMAREREMHVHPPLTCSRRMRYYFISQHVPPCLNVVWGRIGKTVRIRRGAAAVFGKAPDL